MSLASDANLARLESIVGASNFSTEAPALERFAVDACLPRACVHPENVEQLVEVIKLAAVEKLAVIPFGNGTQAGVGMPPARYDIALGMDRLNRLRAYDPGDLTLSVEAGIQLNILNAQLRESGQFLPLDSHAGDFATIGGILATNSSGPLRHSYGTARDFLLGLEFVSGEGQRTKSGARVVKCVAGYDLHKLMTGALGTLGVITSANFKTFPLPPVQATFVAAFGSAERALGLCRAIARSPLQPRALDMVSPELANLPHPADLPEMDVEQIEAALQEARTELGRRQTESLGFRPAGVHVHHWPASRLSKTEWSVVVSAGGNARVVERHRRDLEQMASQAGATSFAEAKPYTCIWARLFGDDFAQWRYIRMFPGVVRQVAPGAATLRVSVPPETFGTVLDDAWRIAERHDLVPATLVRAAGVVYIALLPAGADHTLVERLTQACHELFAAAQRLGGHAVIEFCPTELKRRINVWGAPRGDFALMQKLKQTFDPQNILNPGRYVGGL
jgi:glycolate oxidase FAD binding subunit